MVTRARRSRIPGVLCALLLVLGLGGTAFAVEPPSLGVATDATPEPVAGLSLATMSVEATALDATLLELRAEGKPPAAVQAILAGLDAREAAMAPAEAKTRRRLEEPDAASQMHDARASWSTTVKTLAGEQRVLADYGETLAKDLAILESARERWSAGREGVPADEPGLLALTDSALSAIEVARGELAGHNREVLEASGRVATVHAAASSVLADVEQAVRDVLFTRDGAPMWALPSRDLSDGKLRRIAVESAAHRVGDVADYVESAPWRVIVQLFLALASAWLFLGSRRLPEERRPTRVHPTWKALVERPVSSGVLLSLGLGTALHISAPSAFVDLQVAIAIIPLVRVLGGLIPGVSLGPVYLLFGVYLVNRTVALLAGAGVVYRGGLIGAELLLIGALAWAIHEHKRHAALDGQAPGQVLRWLLLAAVAGTVGALAANVVGFVALATVIVDGSMEALYIAIVLWTTVALLDGCVRFAARLPAAQRLGMVRNHGDIVEDRVGQLLRLAGVAGWFASAAFLFSVWHPLSKAVHRVLAVGLTVGTIDISLGEVLAFFLSVWVAVSVSRFLRFALDEDVLPRMELPKGAPAAVLTLTHYFVVAGGLFFALAAAGAHLDQFAFVAGALGIGIGFGLQGIVNNLVSGLILLFERPIQAGDIIELRTMTGTVQHIGMRACRLRTLDGAEVILPNSDLLTEAVVNWTLSDRVRRFDVEVGVVYGARPKEVIALLEKVVADTPGVAAEPAPEALLDDFGDSSIDFLVRAWAPYEEYIATRSAVRVRIEAALREEGIEIPFPQRDVHVRSVDGGPSVRAKVNEPESEPEPEPEPEPEEAEPGRAPVRTEP